LREAWSDGVTTTSGWSGAAKQGSVLYELLESFLAIIEEVFIDE
jgi:hypothetical protein